MLASFGGLDKTAPLEVGNCGMRGEQALIPSVVTQYPLTSKIRQGAISCND